MLSPDEIVRFKSPLSRTPQEKPLPYTRKADHDEAFDCKKAYGHGSRHDFDTKEERARWGGLLSQVPKGYSGVESGTRSVIREMKTERWLATVDARIKRKAVSDKRFHDFLVNNVFPRFVTRFNLDGTNATYSWESVPQPCLETREAAWIAGLAKFPQWRDDFLRGLIVTALRFVVQHGDFRTPDIAWQNKTIKARLVEAYHLIIDKKDKHRDDWWQEMFKERKAKGDVTI